MTRLALAGAWRAIGVGCAQGFGVGLPRPLEEFLEELLAQPAAATQDATRRA